MQLVRVALLVSAWIEMMESAQSSLNSFVALLVSAWIEIVEETRNDARISVALLVSAWIEIKLSCMFVPTIAPSHSS